MPKREYTKSEIIQTLTARMNWYKKSIHIKNGDIPYENNFDFPAGELERWEGAYVELKNTISMLNYGYDAIGLSNI